MKKPTQYTIRGIPERLDHKLRETADQHGFSINAAAVAALSKGLGLTDMPAEYHDLDNLIGTWVHDKDFDNALNEMDQIDTEIWQ